MKTISAIFAAAALCALPQASAAADAELPSYDMAAKCAAIDGVLSVLYESGTPTAEDKASAAERDKNAQKWAVIALAKAPGDANSVQQDIAARGTAILTSMASASNEDEAVTAIGDDMIECLTYEITVFDAAAS